MQAGLEWPRNRVEASELLAEVRRATGHPRAELEDNPLPPRGRRPRRLRREEWELHREVADAFLGRPRD